MEFDFERTLEWINQTPHFSIFGLYKAFGIPTSHKDKPSQEIKSKIVQLLKDLHNTKWLFRDTYEHKHASIYHVGPRIPLNVDLSKKREQNIQIRNSIQRNLNVMGFSTACQKNVALVTRAIYLIGRYDDKIIRWVISNEKDFLEPIKQTA